MAKDKGVGSVQHPLAKWACNAARIMESAVAACSIGLLLLAEGNQAGLGHFPLRSSSYDRREHGGEMGDGAGEEEAAV